MPTVINTDQELQDLQLQLFVNNVTELIEPEDLRLFLQKLIDSKETKGVAQNLITALNTVISTALGDKVDKNVYQAFLIANAQELAALAINVDNLLGSDDTERFAVLKDTAGKLVVNVNNANLIKKGLHIFASAGQRDTWYNSHPALAEVGQICYLVNEKNFSRLAEIDANNPEETYYYWTQWRASRSLHFASSVVPDQSYNESAGYHYADLLVDQTGLSVYACTFSNVDFATWLKISTNINDLIGSQLDIPVVKDPAGKLAVIIESANKIPGGWHIDLDGSGTNQVLSKNKKVGMAFSSMTDFPTESVDSPILSLNGKSYFITAEHTYHNAVWADRATICVLDSVTGELKTFPTSSLYTKSDKDESNSFIQLINGSLYFTAEKDLVVFNAVTELLTGTYACPTLIGFVEGNASGPYATRLGSFTELDGYLYIISGPHVQNPLQVLVRFDLNTNTYVNFEFGGAYKKINNFSRWGFHYNSYLFIYRSNNSTFDRYDVLNLTTGALQDQVNAPGSYDNIGTNSTHCKIIGTKVYNYSNRDSFLAITDLVTGITTRKTIYGEEEPYSDMVMQGGKIYIFRTYYLYQYDPATDVLSTLVDFNTPIPGSREMYAAHVTATHIYLSFVHVRSDTNQAAGGMIAILKKSDLELVDAYYHSKIYNLFFEAGTSLYAYANEGYSYLDLSDNTRRLDPKLYILEPYTTGMQTPERWLEVFSYIREMLIPLQNSLPPFATSLAAGIGKLYNNMTTNATDGSVTAAVVKQLKDMLDVESAKILKKANAEIDVMQADHGLQRGVITRLNGTQRVAAIAANTEIAPASNLAANQKAFSFVNAIIDEDNFSEVPERGFVNIDDLTDDAGNPLLTGRLYYLSALVAGKLSLTKPATYGQSQREVLTTLTDTLGFFSNSHRGDAIPAPVVVLNSDDAGIPTLVGSGVINKAFRTVIIDSTLAFRLQELPASADFPPTQLVRIIAKLTGNYGARLIANTETTDTILEGPQDLYSPGDMVEIVRVSAGVWSVFSKTNSDDSFINSLIF